MDTGLTQRPQRDSHPSQELVPELQVAGVPQVHPDHKPQRTVQPEEAPYVQHRREEPKRLCGLTSAPACRRPPLQRRTDAWCSSAVASPGNGSRVRGVHTEHGDSTTWLINRSTLF